MDLGPRAVERVEVEAAHLELTADPNVRDPPEVLSLEIGEEDVDLAAIDALQTLRRRILPLAEIGAEVVAQTHRRDQVKLTFLKGPVRVRRSFGRQEVVGAEVDVLDQTPAAQQVVGVRHPDHVGLAVGPARHPDLRGGGLALRHETGRADAERTAPPQQ